jgi:hypothetical protein
VVVAKTKRTGNYVVRFGATPGDRDSRRFVVKYVGDWPSGDPVVLDLPADEGRAEWARLRGDFDVASLFLRNGYDEYGNARRR